MHRGGLAPAADRAVDDAVEGPVGRLVGGEDADRLLDEVRLSVGDSCVVAPLKDARSGSAYTSGNPMSAQLLHAGLST